MNRKQTNFSSTLKFLIISLAILGILIDLFLSKFPSSLFTLVLAGFLVYSVWLYQFDSRFSFISGLILLFLNLLFLLLNQPAPAGKAMVWFYFFLLIGTFQEAFGKRGKGSSC